MDFFWGAEGAAESVRAFTAIQEKLRLPKVRAFAIICRGFIRVFFKNPMKKEKIVVPHLVAYLFYAHIGG